MDSDYLYENDYTKYPIEISYLTNLTTVSLGNFDSDIENYDFSNQELYKKILENNHNLKELTFFALTLYTIPKLIHDTPNLKTLNLQCNRLKKLPTYIKNYTGLKILDLWNNELIDLPEELESLINLEELKVCDNNLKYLPNSIGNIKKLKVVDLKDNNLHSLPKSIIKLENLSKLDLENNNKLNLTMEQEEWIHQLKNNGCAVNVADRWMIKLWAWAVENNISKNVIPQTFKELSSLKKVELDCRNMEVLPNELFSWITLEELVLKNTCFESLPAEIEKLVNLKSFTVSNSSSFRNNLKYLPDEIGKLSKLKRLSIQSELLSIPSTIGRLENLEYLGLLHNNQILSVAEEIAKLQNLKSLFLSKIQLITLPIEICSLQKLKRLVLRDVSLTEVPKQIANLKNLEVLELDTPKLGTLPKEITQLTHLKELRIILDYGLKISLDQEEWIEKLKKEHSGWSIRVKHSWLYEMDDDIPMEEDLYKYGWIPDTQSKGWD